ncbi:MAG: SIMPL domain-containing protein [Fimbriimonadaceae bacterium]|nr:SIMPL domain-containing protein [Fimbriimonadaceae bacterium]
MSGANPYNVGAAAVIAIGVFFACHTLGGAIVRSRGADEMVRVTGSARKEIESDFIIWNGNVSYRAKTVAQAYASVKTGIGQVREFLTKQGVKDSEIATYAITTSPVYVTDKVNANGTETTLQRIDGYELTQVIEVRSTDVDRVEKVSRQVTDLISSGVSFNPNETQYLYTKISEEKVAILAEAAKDARRRAEEIAKSAGGSLGEVRFARMSPLQITPRFSTTVSYDGQNDTTSKEKAITAIVSVGFGVK